MAAGSAANATPKRVQMYSVRNRETSTPAPGSAILGILNYAPGKRKRHETVKRPQEEGIVKLLGKIFPGAYR